MRVSPLSTSTLPYKKGIWEHFGSIFGVMLVKALCGVFGECVAIAGVGVVKNRPVLEREGGYGY